MCFVLICSITAYAYEDKHELTTGNQYRYVEDIDEYLTQLNSGIIGPLNTTTTIFESVKPYESVNPLGWPWTDCSNVLGHKWGDWSLWIEVGPRSHIPGKRCITYIERARYCERTYCNVQEHQKEALFVDCLH